MASQIAAKYSGASVEAVLGSDVTFTLKYMMTGPVGAQPERITWGLGLQAGAAVKVPFVTAEPSGVTVNSNLPPKYKGRVAWTGDWAKREASFSLSNVTRDDEAVYGLSIAFDGFTTKTDSVKLKVLGKFDQLSNFVVAVILKADCSQPLFFFSTRNSERRNQQALRGEK